MTPARPFAAVFCLNQKAVTLAHPTPPHLIKDLSVTTGVWVWFVPNLGSQRKPPAAPISFQRARVALPEDPGSIGSTHRVNNSRHTIHRHPCQQNAHACSKYTYIHLFFLSMLLYLKISRRKAKSTIV